MREGWDVNRAARSFGDANGNPDPPANQPRNPYRRGRTVESSRRRLVRDVGGALRRADDTLAEKAQKRNKKQLPRWTTNNVNLIPILQGNGWLPLATNVELTQRTGAYNDVVEIVTRLRVPPTSTAEQDERLAWFVTATGTESWYSAMVFLKSHSWDVARAIDAWLRDGNIPLIDPPFTVGSHGRGVPKVADEGLRGFDFNEINVIPEDDESWEPTPIEDETPDPPLSDSGSVASLDDIDEARPSTSSGYLPGTNQRSAYVIDEDRRPARINCPDPTKLRIETVQQQGYKIKWFSGKAKDNGQDKAFKWDEDTKLDQSKQIEFDWAKPEHISSLNRWRQEYFRRCTGELAREEIIPFNKYENDWLREQEAIRTEKKFYQLANQDQKDRQVTDSNAMADAWDAVNEGTHKLPLKFTKVENRDLTQRFSQQFENKITYQKVVDLGNGRPTRSLKIFDKRRPKRSEEMVRTQRTRVATLSRHFLVKANNPHGLEPDVDTLSSDTDSDFEDRSGAEKRARSGSSDEDEATGPSKKARVDEEGGEDGDEEHVEEGFGFRFGEAEEDDEDLYGSE